MIEADQIGLVPYKCKLVPLTDPELLAGVGETGTFYLKHSTEGRL